MSSFLAALLAFMMFEGAGAAVVAASDGVGAMVIDHDGTATGTGSTGAAALMRRQLEDEQLKRRLLVHAGGEAVDAGSLLEGGSASVAMRRDSARTGTMSLHEFVVGQGHEAKAVAAWQRFYHAQQQQSACPLPASGFECELGHECTFRDGSLNVFKVLNHGTLTETVFSNGGSAYLFAERSATVPPYYLVKLQCNGEVLLKAPAAEDGDRVDKESCSASQVVQNVTIGNLSMKASVERLTRRDYLCLDMNVSTDSNATGWDGACLLSKSPISGDPPLINAAATTVDVTRAELFEIVKGKFTALEGKLNVSSCPGGAPALSPAQVDGALARKGGSGKGGTFQTALGGFLMVDAFVLTGVSGGAFAPVATIVFGWGAGFVISGATTLGDGSTAPAGSGTVDGMSGANGPAGSAVNGSAVNGSMLQEEGATSAKEQQELRRLIDHRGQDGDKFLKSKVTHDFCADYKDGVMNAYMKPCEGTQQWFFAQNAWLEYNNDPEHELVGRDTTPLKSMQMYKQTLPWAKVQCENSARCQAFCWNPDDLTFFHTQTDQGFKQVARVGAGWECFKKTFFDAKALVSMRTNKCLEYNTGNGAVYMHHCHGGLNQQWYFDGEQLKTKYDDNCLDYAYDDPTKGLYMKPCHGESNQKWYFL